jgi:hypothetical protein
MLTFFFDEFEKAFKAQVCPHFSNITHQTHGRHGEIIKMYSIFIGHSNIKLFSTNYGYK